MKTIKILLFLLLFSVAAKAQLTLENTYDSHGYIRGVYEYTAEDSDFKIQNYIVCNTSNSTVTIYNLDHSLYKTVPLNIEEGLTNANIIAASTHLFNDDDAIEFILNVSGAVNNAMKYSMALYDENGMLQDLGNCLMAEILKTTDNQYKLLTVASANLPAYTSSVYALSGSSPTTNARSAAINETTPYPNPAESIITLPYKLTGSQLVTMNIYDSKGKLIEQKQIDSTFDKLLLNVANYPAGIYMYEYNGNSNRFMVK